MSIDEGNPLNPPLPPGAIVLNNSLASPLAGCRFQAVDFSCPVMTESTACGGVGGTVITSDAFVMRLSAVSKVSVLSSFSSSPCVLLFALPCPSSRLCSVLLKILKYPQCGAIYCTSLTSSFLPSTRSYHFASANAPSSSLN